MLSWIAAFEVNRLPVVADGTPVASFVDFSGNNRNATQSGAAEPTYESNAINGQPVLRCSGTQYMQTISGAQSLTGDWYMAAVVRHSSITGVQTYLAFGNESTGERREIIKEDGASSNVISFNGYVADVIGNVSASNSVSYLVEATKISGVVTVYVNGVKTGSGSPSLNTFSSSVLTIGANNAGGENLIGDIALALFSSDASAARLHQVHTYVGVVYGIAVSDNLPALKSAGLELKQGGMDVIFESQQGTNDPGTTTSQELNLRMSGAGLNVLNVQNTDPTGYSAYVVRDYLGNQVGVFGYGNPSEGAGPFADVNYIESFSFVGAPKGFRFMADGNYGPIGSGFRLYQRWSVETNGDVVFWKLVPWGTTQVEVMRISGATGVVIFNPAVLPTSPSGLASGTIYSNLGVATFAP